MGLSSMTSVLLTIMQKHKYYKRTEIPLWVGEWEGLEINSDDIMFVFICHHQNAEQAHGIRETNNNFKQIVLNSSNTSK
jgi:hypothetical protein